MFLRHAKAYLEQLTLLEQQIQCGTDLNRVLAEAVDGGKQMLDSDRLLIYRFLVGGDGVVIAESVGEGWQPIQGQLIYDPCFETKWHLRYQQGQISSIEDVEVANLVPCYRDLLARLQVRANLVVPILVPAIEPGQSPELWGLFIAHQCQSSRKWQSLDVELLQHLAAHLASKVVSLKAQPSINSLKSQAHLGPDHSAPQVVAGHSQIMTPLLEPTLKHQSQRLATIIAIQQDIASHQPDLEAVMTLIAEHAQNLTHATGSVIELLEGEDLVYRAASGTAKSMIGLRLQTTRSLSGKCIATGQILQSEDTETDPRVNLAACRYVGARSMVVVPLLMTKECVGILKVFSQTPAAFTEQDIQTLQLIAGFLTASIRLATEFESKNALLQALQESEALQKQAEMRLRHQAERERMIYAIAQRIRQSLDLDDILNTTVTEVRHFLQTDRVIIYRFNPDWSGVVVTESVAPGWNSILNMEIRDTYFVENHDRAYSDWAIQVRDNIYTAGLSPCHLELMEMLQVKAKLVVPIWQGEALWGLLVAHQCHAPRHWQPLETGLLLQLATQVAIAIQQSELYRQVQHLNTHLEIQVQERTAQLQQALDFEALLKRMTDHVRDSLDEQEILRSAVQELAEGLGTICCDAGIYNSDQTASTIVYESSHSLCSAQGKTFAIVNTPHSDVYQFLLKGQVCHFCDLLPNPLRADQQVRAVLACPLMDDQGVLGDLWMFKPSEAYFNDQEVRLAQQVANQCAIALRQSRLYRAAQSQVEELARLNQLKDDFLSTVSHELRTPMASMKMAIQMLEICLQPLGVFATESHPIRRYFQVLQTECHREINLINDLLDLTRLDSGSEPLHLSPIYLQFWIPHVVEPFIERTYVQEQDLKICIPEDLPLFTTDLSYLERALTELLHNAFKYTPPREVITISAHVDTDEQSNENAVLWLEVSNSGVEIPEIEHDRIFNKFYRIPNNDPWKYGGTGLGLALVKRLVEQLGGTIQLKSGNNLVQFIMQFPLTPPGN